MTPADTALVLEELARELGDRIQQVQHTAETEEARADLAHEIIADATWCLVTIARALRSSSDHQP